MRSIAVVLLLAFVVEAHVKEFVTNQTTDAQQSMNVFVDKLVDKLVSMVHRNSGNLNFRSGTLYNPGISYVPRGIPSIRPIHNEWQAQRHNDKILRSQSANAAQRATDQDKSPAIETVKPSFKLGNLDPAVPGDPEVVRDPKQKFMLEAPSIFKPYFGEGFRETKAYTIVPNKMWGFEQSQELGSLSVNIRCTVVRLQSGALWVHSPLFPTEEFMAQLFELEGEVAYIVLPTYALEHKLPMKPFIKRVRERAEQTNSPMPQVWAVPDTWSFPLDLPVSWLGIPVDGVLGKNKPPWLDEIEFNILRIADVGKPFIEAVFFHKDTETLLVTDTVYQVSENPPDVTSPSLLLDVAPDHPSRPLPDTPSTRKQAWAKMALLVAFFIPANQRIIEGGKAEWQKGYMDSFEMIKDKLLVSPILRKLVFEKAAPVVREWVEEVCKWPFKRLVAAHYAAPVDATPKDLRRAFGWAWDEEVELPKLDMKTLNDLGDIIKAISNKGTDSLESKDPYALLFDKFFKNLFMEKSGWIEGKPPIEKDT